ncbi:MAG TPA: hypothetical protein VLA77_00770 [Candidatus Saccharimonadales bacterium]|nr:hypothetical protein [Candidatus Saccharimonadales bacterium]
MSFKRPILFAIVSLFSCFLMSNAALANPIPQNLRCTTSSGEQGIKTSIALVGERCIENGSTFQTNPIVQVLVAVLALFAGGVGLVVVGGIVWGGFLYMTARGNSSQTQQAITVIINACVGLLLFIFMFAILNFIIPGGILG